MKILSVALLLMASMAFVLLGCSDKSTSPVTPGEQTIGAPSSSAGLAKMGDEQHSATGSAHYRSIPITGETNVTYSFSPFGMQMA